MHDNMSLKCPRVTAVILSREAVFGRTLAPYLDDPGNLFVISSDFCHWGSRFRYTHHDPSAVQPCGLAVLEWLPMVFS